jgi:uncharacterized membrane protein
MEYNANDPAGTPGPNPYSNPGPNPSGASPSSLAPNVAAAIAYITVIPAILFLLLEPYNKNPFIRFHAIQSIGLGIFAMVVHTILAAIVIIGWILLIPVSLAFLILWIYTILQAYKGQWFKLPIIGNFAQTQAAR